MPLNASIVDLFAGPGGLGEGFTSYTPNGKCRPFHIMMSVEKDVSAHRTLELRAFYRQFEGKVPDEYYKYLKGSGITRAELFAAFPKQSAAAIEETLGGPKTLGDKSDDKLIYTRLKSLNAKDGPWIVIGGPPCQAYSLVGRARNKGVEGYSAEKDRRHFLYEEYLRVLSIIKPEVFVMENVKGILSAKVNGQRIFPKILKDLSHPRKALGKRGGQGYKIYSLVQESSPDLFNDSGSGYIIRAEDYGIPQARHRVILLGVREDIKVLPKKLVPAGFLRTTEHVISDCPPLLSGGQSDITCSDCPPLRSGLSKGMDSPEAWHSAVEAAAKKITKGLSNAEFDVSVFSTIVGRARKFESRGGRFLPQNGKFLGDIEIATWYLDKKLGGFLNHETRGHIVEDLARYMFCATYSQQRDGTSPKAIDFPKALAPNHVNWKSGKFTDRFKVQSANKASSTVTSHISKDGHYFIHPDPAQCRSLTVREAARLQTFPDNYFFEGNRTQQYVQVGNAVPPYLARQIAEIVYRILS